MFHPRLGLPCGLLPLCFPTKTVYTAFLSASHSHAPSAHYPDKIRKGDRITSLVTAVSSTPLPPRPSRAQTSFFSSLFSNINSSFNMTHKVHLRFKTLHYFMNRHFASQTDRQYMNNYAGYMSRIKNFQARNYYYAISYTFYIAELHSSLVLQPHSGLDRLNYTPPLVPTEISLCWTGPSCVRRTKAYANDQPRRKTILSAFVTLRKATISLVMSVRAYGATRLPLDGFSRNTVLEDLSKICRKKFEFD
jgi:hypothetical protein